MFAFIAALAQVGGVILDKITLTRKQVSVHVFVPILFLFLFLSTAILYPFFGHINPDFFTLKYLLLFLAMLVTAVIWNIFYYQGVQSEKVQEFEMILMFQPLLTILLAVLVLKGERNIHIEISAIVAAAALIIAHIKKQHLEFSRGSYKLILAVLFMSVELIIIKEMLNVLSPVTLYFFRTGIIFLFFYIFYHPKVNQVAPANYGLILLTGFLGTAQMVTKFYGFEAYGVVYTSLILILSPLLVYVVSTIYLHEKLKPRVIASALVILGCIVYATLTGK